MSQKEILIKKAGGQHEPFNIEKLERSLQKVHASKNIIQKITNHILLEVEEGMTTHEIYQHAFSLLHKLEKTVALRYSLRRALLNLGPTGFPFEKFISEIFKARMYQTLTDQMVNGLCAEHEIDVVAWKPDQLIMSEVKFHNQLGLKSDLKIVLYVKARFEDLADSTFKYGDTIQPLSEGWLITNTKFTTSAIKYAECKKLKIVGWNYPLDGNLQDMIEQTGLHPITSLHSLSDHDKKSLIEQNIIICKHIKDNSAILETLGLSEANIDAVLEEIHLLTTPVDIKE